MVYGIEKFKEYFKEYADQYVLIGGSACDIILNELGISFRATKDLDMVLIIENMNEEFGAEIWKFIEDGKYNNRHKGFGKEQFYRFSHPEKPLFPKMIELFSRRNDKFTLHCYDNLTPIHIENNIASLSAILLSDAYYSLLLNGRVIVEGFSIIEIETNILFKIKAWLDLKENKRSGKAIDSRNINKHKNDIFRLIANIDPGKKVHLDFEIKQDVKKFTEMIYQDTPDLINLGIKKTNLDVMISILRSIFL